MRRELTHREGGLPARLPGHLRHGRHRRRDGRAVELRGDPEHPFTRGFLCQKVAHYLDRVYHPDRLLYPMRRVGQKGDGKFERISWDEAIRDDRRRGSARSPARPTARRRSCRTATPARWAS